METLISNISIIEYLIALEYLISIIFCAAIITYSKDIAPPNQLLVFRVFFVCIAIILIIITVARFLHLYIIITETGRFISKTQGWYNDRRGLQMMIVSGISVAGILSIILMERIKGPLGKYWFSICGLILLISYIFIRLISYHSVDRFFNMEITGIKLGELVELTCMTWVAVSLAASYISSRKKIAAKSALSTRYI